MKKIIKGIDTAEIRYPHNALEVEGKRATVKTIVSSDGETASIEYRLLQRADSSWWAYDVVIENIGLVSNYRTEFGDIIRRSGFDGLLKMLKERKGAQRKS
jgi:phospholipid transport system substrate-binding protein